jgi:hypothetical protein
VKEIDAEAAEMEHPAQKTARKQRPSIQAGNSGGNALASSETPAETSLPTDCG